MTPDTFDKLEAKRAYPKFRMVSWDGTGGTWVLAPSAAEFGLGGFFTKVNGDLHVQLAVWKDGKSWQATGKIERVGGPAGWETLHTDRGELGAVASALRSVVPRTNPALDKEAAHELMLYIENEYALVGAANSIGKSIAKNLARKIATGKYDPNQAPAAWLYLVDAGAKRYVKEFGTGSGFGPFNKPTRDAVALEMGEGFDADVRSGEIDVTALAARS